MGGIAALAHAAESAALPVIVNSRLGKSFCEQLARELRVAAGHGIGAHVDQEIDASLP